VIDTCASNGSLERIIIPKSQGKIQYRDARKSAWGDLFPHQPKNKPVRKESVQMEDGPGEGGEQLAEGETDGKSGGYKRRRPLDISAEKLLKRMKQKEKKQSRQKVIVDTPSQLQNQAGDSSLKGKKGSKGKKSGDDSDDITLDF